MLLDAVDFLNTVDQNDVLLPVVKYLASQRASSIQQTLATYYFVVVRLVLVHRISLQHCRPVDYVQEPNAEPASSRRNLLGETGMSPIVELLKGTSMRAALVCLSSLVLCGLEIRLLPHRALGAPSQGSTQSPIFLDPDS